MTARKLIDLLTPPVSAFGGLFDLFDDPPEPPEVDSDGRAVVDIRGGIGVHVTADKFGPMIRDVDAKVLEVQVDSPGGSVWDGVAIANDLRNHAAAVEIHVVGQAASAASVIAMAGDSITMHPGSMMMVHNGRAFIDSGTAETLRATAELLDKINVSMAGIYAFRAGGTAADWLAVMADEQWFTADEAVAAGLADDVAVEARAAAELGAWDLTEVFGYAYNGRGAAPAPKVPTGAGPTPDPDPGPGPGPDLDLLASHGLGDNGPKPVELVNLPAGTTVSPTDPEPEPAPDPAAFAVALLGPETEDPDPATLAEAILGKATHAHSS